MTARPSQDWPSVFNPSGFEETEDMKRMTRLDHASARYWLDRSEIDMAGNSCSGPAVERLARFENACVALLDRQEKIAADLEALRNRGRSNTVSFKQLLAEKLMNQAILVLFKSHGLELE